MSSSTPNAAQSILKNKTIFISGASRGIGRAIALRCARAGANIVIASKSAEAHAKLPGTIHSVAQEVEAAGGRALAIQLDVRDDVAVEQAMKQAFEHFGSIDVLVNNASAISLTKTTDTLMKKFDLMFGVNVRATFACSRSAIPYLAKSSNPHILTLSPPLSMKAKWFKHHVAYTMSKYGMSMCTLGMSEELRSQGIAVNSLWPKTTIATAAIEFNFPKEIMERSRTPEIMADAAFAIICSKASENTGNFYVDEEVLKLNGVSDFDGYAVQKGAALMPDFFLD